MDTILHNLDQWYAGRTFMGPQGLAGYGKYWNYAKPTLEAILRHTQARRTILHAGGHIGIFSLALATYFAQVRTFEPADDNFAWLTANVAGHSNIHATYGALGDGEPVQLIRHKYSSCHHAQGAGDVPCYRIDDAAHAYALDVLVLDLEGGELVALRHATEILIRDKPLLIVEEGAKCMRRYNRLAGDVTKFVAAFGYVPIETTPLDIVFGYGRD